MNDPVVNEAAIGKRVRRRRSWYKRRLRIRRMRRILTGVVLGTLLAGACWQNAVSYFSPRSLQDSKVSSNSPWVRGTIRRNPSFMAGSPGKRFRRLARIPGVYPYSVIPGGVKDVDDLRYRALRDWVVRRHFARFDYSHAKLERATEAREVYLSYRIRDVVYWTRKKVRLHPGELLLTDGKITARARCGNQISATPKPEVSEEEPAEDVLDQPVAVVEPAPSLPIRPRLAAPDLPSGQPIPPPLFAGGFIFPYVTMGAPVNLKRCPAGDTDVDGRCRHKHKPPVIPEPPTMVLLGSGLALIVWRYRRIVRPTQA